MGKGHEYIVKLKHETQSLMGATRLASVREKKEE